MSYIRCAAVIYLIVIGLAKDDRARAFKALSSGMLPLLGIIFGLLVGFIAVQVWGTRLRETPLPLSGPGQPPATV